MICSLSLQHRQLHLPCHTWEPSVLNRAKSLAEFVKIWADTASFKFDKHNKVMETQRSERGGEEGGGAGEEGGQPVSAPSLGQESRSLRPQEEARRPEAAGEDDG